MLRCVSPPPSCPLSTSQSMRSHSVDIDNIESGVKIFNSSSILELFHTRTF